MRKKLTNITSLKTITPKELYTTTTKIDRANLSYIKFKEKGKYRISNEIAPGVFVDISTNHKVLGVEVVRDHSVSITRFERGSHEHRKTSTQRLSTSRKNRRR
jgi:uncharacterized protein YuzE